MSKRVLALVTGFVLVGVIIGLLYLELDRVNADLRATLEASEQRNAALVETVEKANTEIVRSNEANVYLNSQVALGNETIAKLNTEVAKGNETIAGLGDTIGKWQVQFNILATTHRTLQDSHAALEGRYDGLKTDLAASKWELRAVMQEKVTLESEYGTLEELRAEIGRLQRMRQPLILGHNDAERAGFLCTGSMEPKITCLDEMIWLTDYRPEDITVGTVISYSPDCWDDTPETNSTAHRVMDIAVKNGVHYYWPKGDSNLEADGCWIPEQHVIGYLIDIHKNVRMENAHLRDMVNSARAAWRNALNAYAERLAYYCGNLTAEACAPLLSIGARQEMSRSLNLANRAYDHFDCWYQNALDSEYPGHIPYSC